MSWERSKLEWQFRNNWDWVCFLFCLSNWKAKSIWFQNWFLHGNTTIEKSTITEQFDLFIIIYNISNDKAYSLRFPILLRRTLRISRHPQHLPRQTLLAIRYWIPQRSSQAQFDVAIKNPQILSRHKWWWKLLLPRYHLSIPPRCQPAPHLRSISQRSQSFSGQEIALQKL